MLDYIYLTAIAPLEFFMKYVLNLSYEWTGSWGLGLIFMSLCVNLALLPLYHLGEKWQEAERRIQDRMKDKLREIKETSRGQERYTLMRTLYRQHGYHPIFAVRTSVGFLIQVPFFFAAYHFLSHYQPLVGVAFGPIANLAQPDGLFVLGSFVVNILPFAMTIINLFSTLVYTNRLNRKDKIQLYTIAALFLVLLYNAAAGLVFYWTCNNIFSFLKNIVYEHFKILDHGQEQKHYTPVITYIKSIFFTSGPFVLPTIIIVLSSIFISYPLVKQHIYIPQNILLSIFLALLVFFCGLCLLFLPRLKKENIIWCEFKDNIVRICFVFQFGIMLYDFFIDYFKYGHIRFLIICSIFIIYFCFEDIWRKKFFYKGDKESVQKFFPFVHDKTPQKDLFCGLYPWFVSGLSLIFLFMLQQLEKPTIEFVPDLLPQYLLTTGLFLVCLLSSLSLIGIWKRKKSCYKMRIVTAILALCFQIGILGTLFISGYFSSKGIPQLTVSTFLILTTCFWEAYIKEWAFPLDVKGLGISALCCLLLILFFYTPALLFTSDSSYFGGFFGATAATATWICCFVLLVYFFLRKILNKKLFYLFVLFLSFITFIVILYTFIFNSNFGNIIDFRLTNENPLYIKENIYNDFVILTTALFFFIIIIKYRHTYKLRSIFQATAFVICVSSIITISSTSNTFSLKETISTKIPTYTDELYSFSKKEKNILVLMLDMFDGGHMQKILTEYPELKKELDGFIFYPDTISAGWATVYSLPSMISGDELHPVRHFKHISKNPTIKDRMNKSYANYFNSLHKQNFQVSIVIQENILNPDIVLSRMDSPALILNSIHPAYENLWKQKNSYSSSNRTDTYFPFVVGIFNAVPYSFKKNIYQKGDWMGINFSSKNRHSLTNWALLDLMPTLSNTNASKNTYKFFHNLLPHMPWAMDIKTGLPTTKDPYPETIGTYVNIDGVVPEHYYCEIMSLKGVINFLSWMKKQSVYNNTQIIIASDHSTPSDDFLCHKFNINPGSPHSLMLVKNRNAHGPLKTSPALMTSADIRLLIEKDLAGAGYKADVPWENPQRIRWHASGYFGGDALSTGNNYSMKTLWKITGTAFKRENWTKVFDKTKASDR